MIKNSTTCRLGRSSVLTVAVLFASASVHADNLVANGSFENPPNQPNANNDDSLTPYGPGYLVGNSGWRVTQNAIELIRNYFVPTDGLQVVDMDEGALPDNRGVIEQTLTTVPGTTYDFSFDMAGNFQGNGLGADPIKRLGVYWNDANIAHLTFDSTGKNNTSLAAMGWVQYDFQVTATSTSTDIEFASETLDPHSAFGALLDNVQVQVATAPDTTDTAALLFLGATGLGWFRIRSRKVQET